MVRGNLIRFLRFFFFEEFVLRPDAGQPAETVRGGDDDPRLPGVPHLPGDDHAADVPVRQRPPDLHPVPGEVGAMSRVPAAVQQESQLDRGPGIKTRRERERASR